jgi:hypothetical protein
VSLAETRERDVLATTRLALAPFLLLALMRSLSGIKAFNDKSPGLGLGAFCRKSASARQQAALIGPVERQIEFGEA